MPLFFDDSRNKRNKQDIDEIFSYIYSDLTSIHPSNEYFRIFLQYFQPLFDLSLGLVYLQNNENIISSYYLSSKNELVLKKFFKKINNKKFFECSNWETYELPVDQFPYIADAKSCFIFPIKINGCFQESGNYYYDDNDPIKGHFYLFSRLELNTFVYEEFFEYTCRQITACFFQLESRAAFLFNVEKNHCNCILENTSPVCNEKGLGLLNKVGTEICKIISVAKKI